MPGLLDASLRDIPSSTALPCKGLSWQSIAKKAQDHRDATIARIQPPVLDITELPLDSTPIPKTVLTAEELRITELETSDLVSKLALGDLTSVEVTKAFMRRAALAQKLVNCITEMMPDTALQRATFLDSYLKEHGKPIGPLHGLPISVKEHINMKGLTCNAGFISWHDRIPDADAHILDILQNAGAVLYVRTTEPQTLMHLETSSNYFGVTVNPFNRALTAGGSSGGEGALIGMRGSCLGIGSDIGGSIRAPAANNGVYGLKPTSFRVPAEGYTASMMGQEHVIGALGPLSTSLEGVKLFMKTVIDAQPWIREPSLIPIPWRTEPQIHTLPNGNKKFKIAILYDDGVVKPHPPILRALSTVAGMLKDIEDIEVVEWEPFQHDYAWEIISSLYFCDGGSEDHEVLAASGEPWRPLSEFIIKEQPTVKEQSIREVWEWTMKREIYRTEYSKLWGDVDFILCPVGPGAAPPHDCARYWGYTSQWNLLDYPALIAPVTKCDPTVDLAEEGYKPRNEQDKYNYELYEPQKYANAPISLQLVGKRYEDEKVVEAMEYIQSKIGLPFAKFV